MSILRPYLKTNEVAVDRDVLDEWMNKMHRIGLTLDEAQDALSIRDEMHTILGQPRWTDKQSLTVEDTPPEPTVAVPVATLREWLDAIERVVSLEEYDRLIFLEPEFMVREDCDEIKKTFKEMHTLLSTNAENDAGVESE